MKQTKSYAIKKIVPGMEQSIHGLIANSFQHYIASDYCEKGQSKFAKYIAPEAILERQADNHHIALLFVDTKFQRCGIARAFVQFTVKDAQQHRHQSLTVNSSPYAVPIYERLGFCRDMEEQCVHGICFTSMSMMCKGAKDCA